MKKVIQSPSAGDGDNPVGASLVVVIPDVQGAVTTQPSFEISLEKYRTNPEVSPRIKLFYQPVK